MGVSHILGISVNTQKPVEKTRMGGYAKKFP